MRCLILTHELERLHTLQDTLSARNHDISIARNLAEAQAGIDEIPHQIIFIDADSEEDSVLQIFEELRSHPACRTTILVALLLNADGNLLEKLLDTGMDCFIEKSWKKQLIHVHMTMIERMSYLIQEQIKAEEAYWASEEHFHALSEESPNMIFINSQRKIIFANRKCVELTGYSREEIYSDSFDSFSLIAPESQELFQSNYLKHLRGEKAITAEHTLIAKDGKRLRTINNTQTILYRGKMAILAILTDITEHQKLLENLTASETRFRSIAENALVGIYQVLQDGEILFINDACCRVLGYDSIQEMMRHNVKEFYADPADRAQLLEILKEKRKVASFEFQACRKDGSKITVLASSTLDGDTITGVLLDITDTKQYERSLKEQEAQLSAIINSIPFDIFALDQNGSYSLQNRVSKEIWGDILGKNPETIALDQESLTVWKKNNLRALQGETVDEITSYSIHGKRTWINNITSPILVDGEITGMVGVNINITDRVEEENASHDSEMLFRALVDITWDAVFLLDIDGKLLRVNHIAAENLGFDSSEEMIEKHPMIQATFVEEDQEKVTVQIRQLFEKGSPREGLYHALRKDGSAVAVEFNTTLLMDESDSPSSIIGISRNVKNTGNR